VAGGPPQVRFDPEKGEIFVIGNDAQVQELQRVLDDLIRQAEEIAESASPDRPIKVFGVEHVDVMIAAAILEQMFNDKAPAAAAAAAQQAAAQARQQRSGAQQQNQGEEEEGQ